MGSGAFAASPDVVFEALKRAVVASGGTLQGANSQSRSVVFKRGGRGQRSAAVSVGPAGPYLVGPDAASLHELVAAEVRNAPAHRQETSGTDALSRELERLAELRERNLLTDEEFANAKAQTLARSSTATPGEKAPTPAVVPPPTSPTPSERGASVDPEPGATTPSVSPSAPTATGFGALLAVWHRQSRRRQVVIGVVVIVLALAGLGALFPAEEDPESSSASASTTTASVDLEDSAAPPEESPPAAVLADRQRLRVARWADDVVDWSDGLAEAFSTIGTLLGDEAFTTRLLLGEQEAVLELAVPLAVMQVCTSSFPDPPANHAQARKVTRLVHRACAQYELAATRLARGVDRLDNDLLLSAGSSMQRGTSILNQATAETAKLQD